jgi:hypothetical protein
MAQCVGRSVWLLVHPDGRVKWDSIDLREDRPKTWAWFTKWRWQRWVMSVDPNDRPFDATAPQS